MEENELNLSLDLGLNASEIDRVLNFENFLEDTESISIIPTELLTTATDTSDGIDVDIIGKASFKVAKVNLLGGQGRFTLETLSGAADNEINGTVGDDDIVGTDFADKIFAFEGDDRVSARLGNDTVYGSSGDDDLAGQGGNDVIIGASGSDIIFGDHRSSDNPDENFFGNDSLVGGGDRDIIFGGLGDDTLRGNSGKDALSGENGNDLISGGGDKDYITGGEGNDTLNGNAGNDKVYGEDADDMVSGGSGDDLLYGDRRDSSSNAIGSDTVFGGSGNDTLIGGAGSDSLDGGADSDRLIGVEDFQIQFDYGADTIDTLTGGTGRDTFVLGGINENGKEVVFYDDGNPLAPGSDDYALIEDFTFGESIAVVGSFDNYVLRSSPLGTPSGTGVYFERAGEADELIAILEGISLFQPSSNSTTETKDFSVNATDNPEVPTDLSGNTFNPVDIFTSA